MARGIFDDKKITITCPGCGKAFDESIGRLKTNPDLTCPGCGKVVHVEGNAGAAIQKVDKAVADLRKTLGKFGKRR